MEIYENNKFSKIKKNIDKETKKENWNVIKKKQKGTQEKNWKKERKSKKCSKKERKIDNHWKETNIWKIT